MKIFRNDQPLIEERVPIYVNSIGAYGKPMGWTDEVAHSPVSACGINFGISGVGEMRLMGSTYSIGPGDAVWYLSGEENSVRAVSDQWEYWWICFNGPLAEAILLSYKYPRRVTGIDPALLKAALQDLCTVIDENTLEAKRKLATLSRELLALMGGHSNSDTDISIPQRFLALIQEEYGDPELNIDIICQKIHTSPATLHKEVKKAFKRTPGEMLRSQRIMHAHALLRTTRMTIKEIAHRTGFCDEAYFCRLMRRVCGTTPVRYRNAHSKK